MPTMNTVVTGPGGAVFQPEGGVIWASSEGQVANAGVFLVCVLTFWLLLPLLYALWRVLATARHSYELTDQRLREHTGVLFQDIEELELYRVKDISVHKPLLQALWGCGQVRLVTTDRSSPVVVLNAIEEPLAVADHIRNCVERCRVAKGVRSFDA